AAAAHAHDASLTTTAAGIFMTSDRITESRRSARRAVARPGPPDAGPRARRPAQARGGSRALMPGHISGDDGSTGTTVGPGSPPPLPGPPRHRAPVPRPFR